MTGFNMPPGVSPSDIPGNEKEDEARVAFALDFDDQFWERFKSLAGDNAETDDLMHEITVWVWERFNQPPTPSAPVNNAE